jgi:deoxyribose-phosphate aldolase
MNQYIDHTYLKPEGTIKEIQTLIDEAKAHQFKSVCIQPHFVAFAKEKLTGSKVLVCTVIGFPLGMNTVATKVYETTQAIQEGADEIDMVGTLRHIKEAHYTAYEEEVKAVKKACEGRVLKVILETGALTEEEIKKASIAAFKGGADFVKTSTGFGPGQATPEAIKIMADVALGQGVKASGGVRTYEDAVKMIEAGATRIGTSNGVAIVTGQAAKNSY